MYRKQFWMVILLSLLPVWPSYASLDSGTQVGNGDNGADLEGAVVLKQGAIVDARAKAVEHLNRLNIQGVPVLGTLIPEVEKAPLYMTQKDVAPQLPEDYGVFHSDMRGLVFARTFAQPHAAVRFFPIAETLNEKQLIALHIHEGLHRALPPSISTNESKVTSITLAITAPGATYDQVKNTVSSVCDTSECQTILPTNLTMQNVVSEPNPIPESARVKQPSEVGYTFKSFQQAKNSSFFPAIQRMHSIHSFLYPFGSDRVPLGFGIKASFIGREASTQAGPLELSARMKLWSSRGFDVGGFCVGLPQHLIRRRTEKFRPRSRCLHNWSVDAKRDRSLLF